MRFDTCWAVNNLDSGKKKNFQTCISKKNLLIIHFFFFFLGFFLPPAGEHDITMGPTHACHLTFAGWDGGGSFEEDHNPENTHTCFQQIQL